MPPMPPPMPPMPPPMPPAGALSSGKSATIASVVVIKEATPEASTRPVRTTLVGSMMPALIMSTNSPDCALNPMELLTSSSSLPTTTAPSWPALEAMVKAGLRMARSTISMPIFWSRFSALSNRLARPLEACSRAEPPPGTMPSSTAARVAFSASTTRSFFSPTSTSEAPPTLMTATPPASLARRSCSFSFSYSEVVASMLLRISSQRSSMASLTPAPSSTMVSSLLTVTFLHEPSISGVTLSSLMPRSSDTTCAPVSTARSCSDALRFSPKPGALTAATFMPLRRRFTTSVASASDSTSSATISSGRESRSTCSSTGRMELRLVTFFSTSSTAGFSNSHFWLLLSVMK
mmetsp:Transcript_1901/g.5679  ORF Transcript_1901/g.5679 Transcript_1901/m.5679 type:complete len:349 (-) Transcript_1901:669-1715(-)